MAINGIVQMENSVGPANSRDLKLQRGLERAGSGINLDGFRFYTDSFASSRSSEAKYEIPGIMQ